MSLYRTGLPQLEGQPFLTDGGIETTLIFHDGFDLPDFAAFHLLKDERGATALTRYFERYADLARRFGTGLILESPTWRASADWGDRLGYSRAGLAHANRASIRMLEQLRNRMQHGEPVVISGCVGPRGDGYVATNVMSAAEAETYHREQIEVFADTDADMVSAITMNYSAEAIGIARAARRFKLPVAVAFTVETDGKLPTGQPLGEAIDEVEQATAGYVSYFMLNCAHPSHFAAILAKGEPWTARIRGLRANASHKSHAELNGSVELDIGNPDELAYAYASLRRGPLRNLNVLGGCCGTDERHIERIARECVPLIARRMSAARSV